MPMPVAEWKIARVGISKAIWKTFDEESPLPFIDMEIYISLNDTFVNAKLFPMDTNMFLQKSFFIYSNCWCDN